MSTDQVNHQNAPKSDGLGGTVFEFPAGGKRIASPLQEPEVITTPKLDLLKHLPAGCFKQYVGDVALMCNIYPSTSLLVALGIVSSVACRTFAVQYQNGELLPVGEYIIGGGLPGDAKSRMLKTYQRPIFEAQKAANKTWNELKKAYDDDPTPAKDKGKFDVPRPPTIFSTDATPEGLEPTLVRSNGYFAQASAEQAVVNALVGAIYGGEGRSNNNDLPLKGFNGEYHSSSRSNSERSCYTGTVVGSITCFSQPQAIETILSKSKGSGLAERFLLAQEPTQQGYRDHTVQHYPADYGQNAYNRVVKDLAIDALALAQDFEQLPAYRLSASDWQRIYLFRNEIEANLREGGKYSMATMRGVAAKVDMHIMKISALLACLYEQPIGLIPSDYVTSAINIMRDMLDYTLSLLVKIGVIGFDAEEENIIAYLGRIKGATRRQLQQARHRTAPFAESPKPSATIRDAIDRLIKKGIVGEADELEGGSKGKKLRLIS